MKFLVWGLGKSGKSATELLLSEGYSVYFGDDKTTPHLWREVLEEVDTVVLSPGIPPSHPLWREAEKRGKEVIGELELAFRFFRGKTIAITGTDGKSTTTRLTYLILSRFFPETFEAGNIGKPFSQALKETKEGIAVLEVSSFQGRTLKTFRPHIGAFISFHPDHLDWHPTLEDYLFSKYKIFKNQTKDDLIILNDLLTEVRNTPSRARRNLLSELKREKGWVIWKGIKLFEEKKLKLKGEHNVYNVAVASLIALEFGLSPEDFREVIYSFRGLPHRLEHIASHDGI
ncbi:MAG: UDP-N-acetylmuramoyl-L-alanine--D-glutamate ligase, partial [Aquificae bacterium]|nr:UDP-N-acetylmuramoyl-L-alanine--D-glutamate ligase [Aquificota bacterium]